MKDILIIHSSLGGGGAERVLIDLLNNFDKKGYRVDLLLVFGRGVFLNRIPKGINFLGSIFPDGYKHPLSRRIFSFLHIVDKYRREDINPFITKDYDVIISFMEGCPLKYHSYILDKAEKNITWVHIDMLTNHWTSFAFHSEKEEEDIYGKMDRIVFVSNDVKESFSKRFASTGKTHQTVIYNPIDKARILASADKGRIWDNHSLFRMVAIGRLVPQKNYRRMIESVHLLNKKGVAFELNILGEGPDLGMIQKMINDYGLKDKVHLLGYKDNPYPYLKESSILIMSSDAEGLPTVICEAFVLGTPVVACQASGCNELIGDSEYGIITESNPPALASGIERMYSSPEIREIYRQKGLNRAEDFSIDATLRQIYNLF